MEMERASWASNIIHRYLRTEVVAPTAADNSPHRIMQCEAEFIKFAILGYRQCAA